MSLPLRGKIMPGLRLRFRWPDTADYGTYDNPTPARPIDFGTREYQSESAALFTAGGITASRLQAITDDLVLETKLLGIYGKFRQLWAVVGGTESAHAINLIAPGTNSLTNLSSMSNSATGIKGDTSSAYADTGISIPTIPQYNFEIGVYVNSSPTVDGGAFASTYTATNNTDRFYIGRSFGLLGFGCGASFSNIALPVNGLLGMGVRDSGPSGYYVRRNGVTLETKSGNVDGRKTGTLRAGRHGSASTDAGIGLLYHSSPLTDAEAASWYSVVQLFETRLGRAV